MWTAAILDEELGIDAMGSSQMLADHIILYSK
jgi:hypothetical protein